MVGGVVFGAVSVDGNDGVFVGVVNCLCDYDFWSLYGKITLKEVECK